MRLLILGGSGGVGRFLVPQALARGHSVVAIVRDGSPFDVPPAVEVLRGSVLDAALLATAMVGVEAVGSSLGLKRENPKNPWSPLTSPPDFCSSSARAIVAAMKSAGVPRIVAVSAAGVAESAPRMNLVMRFLVSTSSIGPAYQDLALTEQILRQSGLAWCALRPVTLTDGPVTGRVKIIDSFPMTAAISRADVAASMLSRLEGASLDPPTPIIAAA